MCVCTCAGDLRAAGNPVSKKRKKKEGVNGTISTPAFGVELRSVYVCVHVRTRTTRAELRSVNHAAYFGRLMVGKSSLLNVGGNCMVTMVMYCIYEYF